MLQHHSETGEHGVPQCVHQIARTREIRFVGLHQHRMPVFFQIEPRMAVSRNATPRTREPESGSPSRKDFAALLRRA